MVVYRRDGGVGPGGGDLLSDDAGAGRMVSPECSIQLCEGVDFPVLDLRGKSVLISVGGTREAIQYILNGDCSTDVGGFYGECRRRL